MKTYELFCERAFSPAGQAAREKMRSQAGLNAARKAADKARSAIVPTGKDSSAIVPTGKTRTDKESVGGIRKSGPGVLKGGALAKRPTPKGSKGGALATRPSSNMVKTTPKPETTPASMGKKKSLGIGKALGKGLKGLGKGAASVGKGALGATGAAAGAGLGLAKKMKGVKPEKPKDTGSSQVNLKGAETSVGGRSSK